MTIFLEIDSFSSLDYFRILKNKLREDERVNLINGLIIKSNFLFKSLEKLKKIKQIITNFDLPTMINPNMDYYYDFELKNEYIENDIKTRYQNIYNLDSFIYTNNPKLIKQNVRKVLNFQNEFFKKEKSEESGEFLDFLDEDDKTQVLDIKHFLVAPFLFIGDNFKSENLKPYITACSEYPECKNKLRLILYFDDTVYEEISKIIQNWIDKFESIILWNTSYNEIYNSHDDLKRFKKFLDKICQFNEKLILYYAGIKGISFLQDYFTGFVVRKQLYPGNKKMPLSELELLKEEIEVKYRSISRNFYNPIDYSLKSKNDLEDPVVLRKLKRNYKCNCFVCKNKLVQNRDLFEKNLFKLLDNSRNKFYHNIYNFMENLDIILNGTIQERNNFIKKFEKYNIWRDVFG